MVKEKKADYETKEEEAVRAFLAFRSFTSDKQAFAIAFMNGMEFQRNLDRTEGTLASVKRKAE